MSQDKQDLLPKLEEIELVYVGNDHYQTIEKIPDDTPNGSDYWACYIPRVITGKLGLIPKEHELYILAVREKALQAKAVHIIKGTEHTEEFQPDSLLTPEEMRAIEKILGKELWQDGVYIADSLNIAFTIFQLKAIIKLTKADKHHQPKIKVLGEALIKLLTSLEVINSDTIPTYPELIMAAEEFIKHRLDKSFSSTQGKPDREKIARYQMALYCKAKGWEVDNWDDLPVETREKYYAEADEILAFIPNEEDELKVVGMIRKQERERVVKEIEEKGIWAQVPFKVMESEETMLCLFEEDLQALKGKK